LDRRKGQIAEACNGTNTWLWSHSNYRNFEKCKSGILWIEGKPGSGKSVLAKSIQQRLSEGIGNSRYDQPVLSHAPSLCLSVGDWYYHGRLGGDYITHDSCVRALLYKLLRRDRSLFQYFQDTYRELGSKYAHQRWGFNNLCHILEHICASDTNIICVLDAVDEAKDATILDLCKRLVSYPESRTRFVILSRKSPSIERALCRKTHILLEMENGDDLLRIIDLGLTDLAKEMHALHFEDDKPLKASRRKLPGPMVMRSEGAGAIKPLNCLEKSSLQEIKLYLQKNACNTILWVKLVLDELMRQVRAGMCTFKELKAILPTLPPELTKYYSRMVLALTERADVCNLKKARRALMWVSGASELGILHLQDLWEALAIPEFDYEDNHQDDGYDCLIEDREPIRSFDELRRKLHLMCGSFLEVLRPEQAGDPYSSNSGRSIVQLMHQTVKEFLNQPELAGDLHFEQSAAVRMVERECSRYLRLLLHSWSIAFKPTANDIVDVTNNPLLEDVAQWLDERCIIDFAIKTASKSNSCEVEISKIHEMIFTSTIIAPAGELCF
jgi:hypothetical protein